MDKNFASYTEDELITRVWDVENIRHTMNRMCYYVSAEEYRKAINELWVTKADNRRTASLGVNHGYYVGLDEVVRHLVLDRTQHLYENLNARAAADPSIECSNLNLGYGCAAMMTLNTPLIKVTDDGRYGKYMGYALGFTTEGKPDGTADSFMTFDRVLADLVKEDDDWKIWHYVVAHDHTVEAGTNYSAVPVRGWEDPLQIAEGTPTVSQTVYEPLFGWEYVYEDMPRKHYTYTDKMSYGPNGDLGKPYFRRCEH